MFSVCAKVRRLFVFAIISGLRYASHPFDGPVIAGFARMATASGRFGKRGDAARALIRIAVGFAFEGVVAVRVLALKPQEG